MSYWMEPLFATCESFVRAYWLFMEFFSVFQISGLLLKRFLILIIAETGRIGEMLHSTSSKVVSYIHANSAKGLYLSNPHHLKKDCLFQCE